MPRHQIAPAMVLRKRNRKVDLRQHYKRLWAFVASALSDMTLQTTPPAGKSQPEPGRADSTARGLDDRTSGVGPCRSRHAVVGLLEVHREINDANMAQCLRKIPGTDE